MSEKESKDTGTSRRTFLRNTAMAAAAFHVVPGYVVGANGQTPPSDRLNVAGIGVGGMGRSNLKRCSEVANIVALCDVDQKLAAKTFAEYPKAKVYTDYREMIAKQKDIDAIVIATPDHTHAMIAMEAMRAGKHVYVQKPMTYSVSEARLLTEAARKYKVVTQMGNQGHSEEGLRLMQEWFAAGALGQIRDVHCWTNRPIWPQGMPRPTETPAVPTGLDWDLWIGPAPMRPYHPTYHPFAWRAWQDFGTGWSGDIGCHIFDPVWKGLGLKAPLTVWAEVQESWKNSPARRADNWPQGDHIIWTFPGDDKMASGELELEWFDGEYYPPEHIRKLYSNDLKEYPPESAMLIGTEGSLLIPHGSPPQLLPEDKFSNIQRPKFPPRNHYHHFVDACLGQEMTESHFAQTGPMTEAILLGTLDPMTAMLTSKLKVTGSMAYMMRNVPTVLDFVRCAREITTQIL